MVNPQTGMEESSLDTDVDGEGQDDQPSLAFDLNQNYEKMDWWPNLADLDRLNILNAPKEDRARLLASKYSKPVEEIMLEIGNKTDMDYQEDFEMLPEHIKEGLTAYFVANFEEVLDICFK